MYNVVNKIRLHVLKLIKTTLALVPSFGDWHLGCDNEKEADRATVCFSREVG